MMTPSFMKNKDAIFYFVKKETDTLLWKNWKNDLIKEFIPNGACQILTVIGKKRRSIGVKNFDEAIDTVLKVKRQYRHTEDDDE